MLDLIWLIPILPLIGVAINGLFGRRLSRQAVGLIACGAVLAAFLLAAGAVMGLAAMPAGERFHEVELAAWLDLGPLRAGAESLRIPTVSSGRG